MDSANAEQVEFILIAGDLFEDNAVDRGLIQKIAYVLARFQGPVYLIPGNHDPVVPGCVWDHPAWRSAKNLFVLIEEKAVEIQRGKKPSRSIEEAEVVVAGGAGIGSREDWKLLETLAENLQGAVGGTRPPLDEGWIAESQMIGQSGKTIRPKLYIGVGISGVIQHVVGIQDAKMIIAINNNPQAAIFQTADLGVVSDFRKIVPLLIEELKKISKDKPVP